MSAVLTIIIPSVCTQARHASLLRAIAGALGSAPVDMATVLIVANGPGVVDEIVQELAGLPRVCVLHREEGSLPKAQLAGRGSVVTPFFAFLDDDDELLPGASTWRLEALAANPTADLCITNGWREVSGQLEPMHPSLQGVEADPLRALLARNWLASSAAMFRTATVGLTFFEEPQPYAEWTWLAYRLLLAGKRVAVVDRPGYVIHDTPGSLSKSGAYFSSYVGLFDRMLTCNPPVWVRDVLLHKRCAALHDLAGQSLDECQVAKGWSYHRASLFPIRHGWPYLAFSRKFATAALQQIWKGHAT